MNALEQTEKASNVVVTIVQRTAAGDICCFFHFAFTEIEALGAAFCGRNV